MTDQPSADSLTDEEIYRLAQASVAAANVALSELLVDAVDQLADATGTFRHDESTVYLFDRAEAALAVEHASPRNVVASLARMTAMVITELSQAAGRDPKEYVRTYAAAVAERNAPDHGA